MNTVSSPSIDDLKTQARLLRLGLAAEGTVITHGKALELLAHSHGFKDWNTMHATIVHQGPVCPVNPGARVRGRYLGQRFEGYVIGATTLPAENRFRVTLQFDQPIDVVTFARFSNLRRRVSCIVDHKGVSSAKTSDGRPHMQLDIARAWPG